MWNSLRGLVSASQDDPIEVVQNLAQQCQWWALNANSEWFGEEWNLGMVALRPDGLSLAILAATDTD